MASLIASAPKQSPAEFVPPPQISSKMDPEENLAPVN